MTKKRTGWTPERRAAWNANTRPLGCRVDPETREEVEAYAKANKYTLAQALRQLVEIGLEGHL
jgi:hypothetical protein